MPDGFAYQQGIITADAERELVTLVAQLPFREFEFHGFTGKRRVKSFGWKYDFATSQLKRADDIPEFILPLRQSAAHFAGLDASSLPHVLVTEYSPGAAIGWHRDKAVFGDVIGVSLLAPATFRLRRRIGGAWERASIMVEPRSVYLLRGAARTEWEHSIPAVAALRYSITFRTLR